jgi:hypothetical protein
MWTALTTALWLQALFALLTAFIHFYLFFILTIPFDHLVSKPDRSEDQRDISSEVDDDVQQEVNIRARCERPPFEEYIWVWWAWWGLRKGPVGHIYGLVTGSLSIGCVSDCIL